MKVKLSICIPTYNRLDYLKNTIDCISKQLNSDVEIFVSDNASIDGTINYLIDCKNNIPNFFWYRFEENVGYDRNFINLIKRSNGDYCWILSSDDLVECDAVENIISVLKNNSDVSGLSINGSGYSKDMSRKIQESTFSNAKNINQDMLYSDGAKAFCDIGDYFGFISAQVIKRDHALEVIEEEPVEDYLNGYVHVYVIGKILQKYQKWYYISKSLIKWRSGNDSLNALGSIKRLAIDVNGFSKISKDIWNLDSLPYKNTQKRICNYFVSANVFENKMNKKATINYKLSILKMCLPVYWRYSVFWYKVLPIIILPRMMLIWIKKINSFKYKKT